MPEVAAALERHRPDVVVVNAGGARFLEGDPITMAPDDVIAVARAAPGRVSSRCTWRRSTTASCAGRARGGRVAAGVDVLIPEDGETLEL